MGATYRNRKQKRSTGKKSYKWRSSSRVTRKAGAFGLYRSTRFARIRNALRVPRMPTQRALFPNNGKYIRHKYVDKVALSSPGLNGIQTYVFRANSLYDPDYTGTGHQPMFYDEMVTHYNKYTVMYSKLKVCISPNDNSYSKIWGIALVDDASEINASSTHTDTLEQYSHTNMTVDGRRTNSKVLTKSFYAPTEFKTSRTALLADDQQAVTSNSNPPSSVARYFIIWCMPGYVGDTLPGITIQVEISYSVMWRYSKPATGS